MLTIRKSIEIRAPIEEVFGFFSEPENLPEVWPSLVEVSNVKRATNGPRGFDWVYKMAGIRFKGHSETLEWEENKRAVTKNEKGIPSKFTYTYDEIPDGTRVSLRAEYEIPNKLLRKLAEPIIKRLNEHEADTLLNNLKARMELAEKSARPAKETGTARAGARKHV